MVDIFNMTNSIIIISCKKQLYKGFESYNQWQFHSPHVRRDDFKTLHGSSLFLFCKSKLQYFSGLIQYNLYFLKYQLNGMLPERG